MLASNLVNSLKCRPPPPCACRSIVLQVLPAHPPMPHVVRLPRILCADGRRLMRSSKEKIVKIMVAHNTPPTPVFVCPPSTDASSVSTSSLDATPLTGLATVSSLSPSHASGHDGMHGRGAHLRPPPTTAPARTHAVAQPSAGSLALVPAALVSPVAGMSSAGDGKVGGRLVAQPPKPAIPGPAPPMVRGILVVPLLLNPLLLHLRPPPTSSTSSTSFASKTSSPFAADTSPVSYLKEPLDIFPCGENTIG